jgi:hypothetical protein
MSIGLTSDRVLDELSPRRAIGSSRLDLTLGVQANPLDDPLGLSNAELADLRRALELDFGPDLSSLRVYVGRKAGPDATNPARSHYVGFWEPQFKPTDPF